MALRALFSKLTGNSSDLLSRYLSGSDLTLARKLVSSGIVTVANQSWQVGERLLKEEATYPQLFTMKHSEKHAVQIKRINGLLMHAARVKSYEEFAKHADTILPRLFAQQIEGLEILREAFALQLFARDPIHILCLADPDVGISTLASDAVSYHPVSIVCDILKLPSAQALWQGADGKSPGIIAGAHQGIVCLDRFEKLGNDQRTSIVDMIDKSFITFNSEGTVTRTPVTTRVLAITHPHVDSFVGKDAGLIKQQVPFDFSIISHFHLTFLVQRAALLRFADSKLPSIETIKLEEKEIEFIRDFVSAAEDREVLFSKEFQPLIVEWTAKLKTRKNVSYLYEITPNTIIAVVRLSQSRARMKWRTDVTLEDLKVAMDIVQTALEIR